VTIKAESSRVTETVFQAIDEAFTEEVSFLKQLIRIPTVNPPGRYDDITTFLTSYASDHGITAEVHETPSEVCQSAGVDSDERRLSVKMRAGSRGSRPRILLLAHLDTVPAGDASGWKHDPFGGEIVGNRIYGRGALDCKGRIAGYFFAQLALMKTLRELPFEVCVAATADEEIGGTTGAKYHLENGNLDCDYCIGEGYTWEVFNGFKGLLWLRASIKGKSAHGATPQLGVSVVPPLEGLLRELRQYRNELSSRKEGKETTLNIGMVRAGTKINMVPDSASVELDLRVGEEYGLQHAIDDISGIVDMLKKTYSGLTFTTEFLNASEPVALSANHELVRAVQSSAEEVTKSQVPVKLWFAHSDTLHFLKKGIPAVNYGVGRPGIAHSTDEYLDLDDLKLSTKAVALSLIKLGKR
jgi:succinyl-diaminopimelate desuccinylase